jgi:hypothetical protein
MRRLVLAVSTVAVAAITGACGGSDAKEKATTSKPARAASSQQRSVVATIDELQQAAQHGNAGRICGEIFTQKLAQSIKAAAKRSCATEVRERLLTPRERISVGRDIRVNGDHATAVIREQNGNTSTLFLVKQGGRWKIERLRPVPSP